MAMERGNQTAAAPVEEEVGTRAPRLLPSGISGTRVTANKGRSWHNCHKFPIALHRRGVQGFGLLSVCRSRDALCVCADL